MKKCVILIVFFLLMIPVFVFAETRSIPYTQEELFDKSTFVFEGIVLEITSVSEYEKFFPVKAKIGKILKGSFPFDEINLTFKHPGRYVIFDTEYHVPYLEQKGIFYVFSNDTEKNLLIRYQQSD